MASNNTNNISSSVQHQQQQQANFPQLNTSPHHCKECGLYLNSAESLEVHLQYHKENLLNKWATQAQTSHSEETNNNNTKTNNSIKREFIPNNTIAAADSSDNNMTIKKSPEYSRTTPETIFGHPPTPQSYQSASSPYQNHDNSAFSPNFQNYQIKPERNNTSSPNSHYQNNYNNFAEMQFFNMDAQNQQAQQQQYQQDFSSLHKNPSVQSSYRYHPYQQPQHSPYERSQSNAQVSSSSPAYPPQPTPSPSPKQCDKCGYVCDSASQLIEHLNIAHPPTPYHHPNQHFMFNSEPPQISAEDDAQSEILDLDSHKVHQVYPEEESKRQNGDLNGHNNPHSVSALLNSWSPPQQKLFPPPQPQQTYRPFEHLPAQPSPAVISSTQVASNTPSGATSTKSANWKSNEARRPKTYNCTACNKWFTSSGHLKRHYNTTLHKNAVKSSGQPDPASLPISAHHHPARDSNPNKEEQSHSPSTGEEDTNSMPPQFERVNAMPGGLLQQPPNGPYDRQPPPNLPMAHLNPNMSNGSPPNGEAGLSPTTNIDSRGLLNTTPNTHHGFNMAPPPPHMMPPIENSQFQMYPNGSAPHVTQVMVTNSPSITGEFAHHHQQLNAVIEATTSQPLPSFAQFQAHRYGILNYGNANVGGGGPVTAPYCYYQDPVFDNNETRTLMYKTEDEEYKLTVLTVADPAPHVHEEDLMIAYSPENHNNNIEDPLDIPETKYQPPSPEKAHIKRDYEENSSPQITSTVQATSISNSKQGIHKCIDCDKLFNKACYLTQHNKTFHCGDKPFKCTRCGKRFSSEVTYQEHLSKHAGDKPHKCDLCPKQFNHKTDLRRHMCLHTGQKPYTCDTCGKGFIRKDHMLKHCETHLKKSHQIKAAVIR